MRSFIQKSQTPSKVCKHWHGSTLDTWYFVTGGSRRLSELVPISASFATQNFSRHPGLGRGERKRRSRRMNESIFFQDWGKITSIKTRASRRAMVGLLEKLRNLFCIILSANFPVFFPKVPFIEDVRVFPLTKDFNINVIKFRMTFPPFFRILWKLKAFWDDPASELGRSWKFSTFIQLRFSGHFLGEFMELWVGRCTMDRLVRICFVVENTQNNVHDNFSTQISIEKVTNDSHLST